ncbi:MAG: histidine-type phosphatase, partial [Rhodospirillaceae bacterium]|nr:histidine-type phosphatase [Rhodospirillaceae bacterium]
MRLNSVCAGLATLLLLAGLNLASPATAQTVPSPVDPQSLKLERVVMVMRHGIRAPLKSQIMPEGVAAQDWAPWTTPIGNLTPRGAQAIGLMAQYDREYWARQGLLAEDTCPPPNAVFVWSNAQTRTIETGKAWVKGGFPLCAIGNKHFPEGTNDPMFEPFDAKTNIDAAKAVEAGLAYSGGLEQTRTTYRTELTKLGQITGCCSVKVCADANLPPNCSLADLPGDFVAGPPGDRPKVSGVFDYTSTAAQTLLLQYLEGMPLKDVGWGRATPADLELIIGLHTMKANLYQRGFYIAQYGASLMARRMLQVLEEANAPQVIVFVGHDSNINDLSGLLGFHFKAKSYAKDVPVPGGAFGLELLSDANGQKFVRGFYRAQTMNQMRNLEVLSELNPPYREVLSIEGCSTNDDPTLCRLETFS